MNSNTELISIVIPTHNISALLKRAIDSALRQTYKNIEIIVVDDGSQDDTAEVVKTYQTTFGNIKYIKNGTALGACNARNRGIDVASGEFITGLDDDDEFTPNRIDLMLEAYSDDYSFVCTDIKVVTTSAHYTMTSDKYLNFKDLLWGNTVGSQILVKRERMVSLGSFDENLPSAQDWDMWLRLTKKFGQAKRIKESLYIMHTEHDLPRITTSSKRRKGYFLVYNKYKKFMSRQQRVYRLMMLKRHEQKKVPFTWVLGLFPTLYFKREIRSIISKNFPFIKKIKKIISNKKHR